jgi:SH3 domain-containing protein
VEGVGILPLSRSAGVRHHRSVAAPSPFPSHQSHIHAPGKGPVTEKQSGFRVRPKLIAATSGALLCVIVTLQADNGVTGVIDDRDGYTNIRASASKESAPVGQVKENEQFTVYPDETSWWRIRTKEGLTGFIHRSCVRLLESKAGSGDSKSSAPLTISRDVATLEAWTRYVAIQESERSHQFAETEVITRECEKIPLEGVDPVVAAHIGAEIAFNKNLMAMNNRVQAALTRVKPMVALRDSLRSAPRSLGGELMPDAGAPEEIRRGTGQAIGELLLLYCFSDATAVDLPDRSRVAVDHDRLLVEEAIINLALGLENPEGLKRLLGYVRNRAFAARLQSGRWILRAANGDIADLEMSTDLQAAWNAGGWVTIKWRQRGRAEGRFQYEFAADGTFHLLDRGMGALLMGKLAPRRIVKAAFVRPTVLQITDDEGSFTGTWEQISSR